MSLIARFSLIAAIAFSLASCGGGGGGSHSSTPVSSTGSGSGTGTGTGGGGGAGSGSGSGSGTGTGTGTGTVTPVNALPVSLPTQTGINVTPISVNVGVNSEFPNLILVSVTVCSPTNAASCVTIPNIQVDTGSVGLRVLDSAVVGLNLPAVTNTGGSPVGECAQFADGASWGAVRYASVTLGGLTTTSAIPIQVIDDKANSADVADQANTPEPTACSNAGTAENTAATLGANGIIGIGYNVQDCGTFCQSTLNNGNYYGCVASSCSNTVLNTSMQVSNPTSSFASGYSNGNVIELPAVPDAGASVANGYLIFGIGASGAGGVNVALPNGIPLGVDNENDLTVVFNGTTYSTSFIDSGSSVYFFNDSAIAQCSSTSEAPGFYCPTTEFSGSITIMGNQTNLGTVTDPFMVGNAVDLFTSTTNANAFAFDNLGAPNTSISVGSGAFDVGEPFFYGKSIFTVIEGQTAGPYTGPFAAVGTAP